HHQAIAEKEADTLDRLTFFVISPVNSENMIDVLWVADDICVRTINRGPINVSESIELIVQPAQQILRRVVLLGWPWRDSSPLNSHCLGGVAVPTHTRMAPARMLAYSGASRAA